MKQKILSICFPTYNRAECIGEQLKRLSSVDKSVLDELEIIVSDNCSNDSTAEVIKSFQLELGFQYNRNDKNMGPDENFLYCFKHATGKYIWLVGDDDYLKPENLHVVVDTLKNNDLGFLYITPGATPENPIYKEYSSKEAFLKVMDKFITFLTSSIVRNEYVQDVDVSPYKGTWQEYVPFFLTAIIKGSVNGELLYDIYEAPAAAETNGGYKIFNVFGTGFLKIVRDYYMQGKISKKAFEIERKASFNFLMPYAFKLLVNHQKGNFLIEDAWDTLNGLFGKWNVKNRLIRNSLGVFIRSIRSIMFEK